MSKQSFGCLGILLVVVLAVSLLFNVGFIAGKLGTASTGFSKMKTEGNYEEVLMDGEDSGYGRVAVIDVFGVISYGAPGELEATMVDDIVAKLKQVREDDSVKSVILRIDSPGGEVTASDILYHEVAKTNAEKPVISFIDSVGASGAYYTAMGSRHIMANDLSITASIGVILQSYEFYKLADKIGIDTLTFKSGKMKDMLNPARPATEEEKAFVQNLINETYDRFVGIVAKSRHLDETTLRNTVADGRILSGKQALDAHLIDQTGYIEDAFALARKLGGLHANAPVVRLTAPFSLGSYLRMFSKSGVGGVNVNLVPQNARVEAGKFYYLSPFLSGGQ